MTMSYQGALREGGVIRRARKEDRLQAMALVTEVLGNYGITPNFDRWEADIAAIGEALSRSRVEVVAEKAGVVLGVAVSEELDEDAALLSGIYVSGMARREGIGSGLLACIVQEAIAAGYSRLYLETRERFVEAIRMYEAKGWRKGEATASAEKPQMTFVLDLSSEWQLLLTTRG